MATVPFLNGHLYYEVHGTGQPLILVNGIMMSTRSWAPFIPELIKHRQVILLDMVDQGQSVKMNKPYTLSLQAEALATVIQHLQLPTVDLVGISYGGEVVLTYASMFPETVRKLILLNTVAYTSSTLKRIGTLWNDAARSRNAEQFYQLTIPTIYSRSFIQSHTAWMDARKSILLPVFSNPDFLDAMIRLTNSAESFDIRNDMSKITMPTLIVGGDQDQLTPLADQYLLNQLIPQSSLIQLHHVGHASMYEKPELFLMILLGFLLQGDEPIKI